MMMISMSLVTTMMTIMTIMFAPDDNYDNGDHVTSQVSVKGKGAMITYWLVGEEPALRAARSGLE